MGRARNHTAFAASTRRQVESGSGVVAETTVERFNDVMGETRGIGGGHDLDAEQPNEHAREQLRALSVQRTHNLFAGSLTPLLASRRVVWERPLLRELADGVSVDAAKILGAAARGERQEDHSQQRRAQPFAKFIAIAGLERDQTQILEDSRLQKSLADALTSALDSNVSTAKGLAKRMCEAWRETLTEIVLDAVFASEEPLWNALGKSDDHAYRANLPASTPPITALVSRSAYSQLLRPERPTVDFSACGERGFSVRENFRDRSRIHDALWPLVHAGLAQVLAK